MAALWLSGQPRGVFYARDYARDSFLFIYFFFYLFLFNVKLSLSNIPAEIAPHLPDLDTDPVRFTEVMLGLEWIKDTPTQTFTINFLTQLKNHRNSLIFQQN